MHELIHILQGIIERGYIFAVIVAAVYIASKLIKFDNLAVEGAFGIGGAATAYLINAGFNPWIALVGAACVGALSGIITGILHTKLKLNPLISGIVVTTGLFSITLKIAGSNMSIHNLTTIFNYFSFIPGQYQALCILTVLVGIILISISWFLKTEIGFLLYAVGDTPQMLTNIGKNIDGYVTLGITLSNILAALSGALFVQYAGYFSIWGSVGILIIGLAGMILAEKFSPYFGPSLVLGSIAYQAIIALTFELQVDQDWNKLITALLIVFLIIARNHIYKK